MPSREKTPGLGALRRWILRSLAIGLLLTALLAGLCFTGIPQRAAARFLLASQLGGDAQISSVGLGNPLVIQGITLSSRAAALYGPLVQLDRLETAYHLTPDNKRYLKSVAITGLNVSLEQGAAGSNFQFLIDRFSQPAGGGDATPWIPEVISVDQLGFSLHFPTYQLQADHLGIHAELGDATTGSAHIAGPSAALAWSSELGGGSVKTSTGAVALDASWTNEGVDVDADIDLGALARLKGTFSTTQRSGMPYYALSIPEAALQDPLWGAMINDLSPVPTRFDGLTLTDSDVHFHFPAEGPTIDQASVDATFTGFSAGPMDAPYYSGPLRLALRGNYGATTEIVGAVTLREGLKVDASFQLTPEGLGGTFGWEPWPREDLLALTPPAYAGYIEMLQPLARLGAKGTLTQTPDLFKLDGHLAAGFGQGPPMDIPMEIAWTDDAGVTTLTVSVEASMDQAHIKSTTSVPEGGTPRVENTLTDFSPNAWARHLLGSDMLAGLTASLSGSANLSMPPDQPLQIDLDLRSPGLAYGAVVLPAEAPLTVAGTLRYDTTSGKLGGDTLKLAQEGTADLMASKWSLDLTKAALTTRLMGTASLGGLGAIIALPELYGDATIEGTLSASPAKTAFQDFTASSDSISYGEFSVPYGSQLTLAGGLVYDSALGTLQMEKVKAAIDTGTRIDLEAMTLHFAKDSTPMTAEFNNLKFDSDLSLLKSKQLIDEVTGGQASLSSEQLAWNGAAISGLSTWALHADTLVLPEKMGRFEALDISGNYDPASGQEGGGPLAVGPFSIYEIPFGATSTTLRVKASTMGWDPLVTAFLGGTLVLEGEVKFREANYPAELKAEVHELDLEQFTQTFKPPDVVMTGKVNGTADLVVSMEGLVDLKVDLTASENLTLNQAAVRQILMSQYVNDAVGSKSIQKIMEKVIGKDEQRSFEKAILTLGMKDGLIVGEARLESKNLDVTVDINAEPEAILQAIQSSAEDAP